MLKLRPKGSNDFQITASHGKLKKFIKRKNIYKVPIKVKFIMLGIQTKFTSHTKK